MISLDFYKFLSYADWAMSYMIVPDTAEQKAGQILSIYLPAGPFVGYQF
jgi:hypothetical protein